MVKVKIRDETKDEKFKRIAEARTNKILKLLSLLRNCSNVHIYSYSESQINRIFRALDDELKITKLAFYHHKKKEDGFKL